MLPRDVTAHFRPTYNKQALYAAVQRLGFSMGLVHARRLVERGQVIVNGFRCRDPMLKLRMGAEYKITLLADPECTEAEAEQVESARERVEHPPGLASCALSWVVA